MNAPLSLSKVLLPLPNIIVLPQDIVETSLQLFELDVLRIYVRLERLDERTESNDIDVGACQAMFEARDV
jgi:hypothetical protein